MKASKIILSNRTKKKAEDLKVLFENLKVVEWGMMPGFDVIINATSRNNIVMITYFNRLDAIFRRAHSFSP